jgi:hypothetical protein
LALVQLARAIPNGLPTYALALDAVALGTEVVMVGYGASGDGGKGATVSGTASVKRVGRNVIDGFGQQRSVRGQNGVALYDFDGPAGSVNRFGGPTLGNDVETIVASGDSGGPCFVYERGQWKLAAVSTFVMAAEPNAGASVFGSIGGAVLVAPHLDWIKTTMRPPSAAHQRASSLGHLAGLLRRIQGWFASTSSTVRSLGSRANLLPTRGGFSGSR